MSMFITPPPNEKYVEAQKAYTEAEAEKKFFTEKLREEQSKTVEQSRERDIELNELQQRALDAEARQYVARCELQKQALEENGKRGTGEAAEKAARDSGLYEHAKQRVVEQNAERQHRASRVPGSEVEKEAQNGERFYRIEAENRDGRTRTYWLSEESFRKCCDKDGNIDEKAWRDTCAVKDEWQPRADKVAVLTIEKKEGEPGARYTESTCAPRMNDKLSKNGSATDYNQWDYEKGNVLNGGARQAEFPDGGEKHGKIEFLSPGKETKEHLDKCNQENASKQSKGSTQAAQSQNTDTSVNTKPPEPAAQSKPAESAPQSKQPATAQSSPSRGLRR